MIIYGYDMNKKSLYIKYTMIYITQEITLLHNKHIWISDLIRPYKRSYVIKVLLTSDSKNNK